MTLIELLMVVSLIAIIAASSAPLLIRFFNQNQFETTMNKLMSTIYKAQEYAVINKDNTSWGVCLYNNKIRLFAGDCNVSIVKEDFNYPASISISNLNTITFSAFRGEPSQELNIIVSGAVNTQSINLNSAGGITYY